MHKGRTPGNVYDSLSAEGSYEEANLDKDEVEKIKKITIEDYEFGKGLKDIKKPNYRVIFNIYYDVLRELCGLLMRFKKQKTSNHQGLFAFVVLNFSELDFSWDFLETVRKMRNQNKYLGVDITGDMWKQVKFQMDLYISTLKKEIEKRIKNI